MNINPFMHGSTKYTDIMKTKSLKQALNKYGFDAAFGSERRDEEKSHAKERIYYFRDRLPPLGSEKLAPGAVVQLQRPDQHG